MPGYAWVIIWVVLSLAALSYLGSVLFTLTKSALSLAKEVQLNAEVIAKLRSALNAEPESVQGVSNIFDDPKILWLRRLDLLQAKNRRKQAKQHRLISKLNSIKPEERTFDA
jgi:hypothetical protein